MRVFAVCMAQSPREMVRFETGLLKRKSPRPRTVAPPSRNATVLLLKLECDLKRLHACGVTNTSKVLAQQTRTKRRHCETVCDNETWRGLRRRRRKKRNLRIPTDPAAGLAGQVGRYSDDKRKSQMALSCPTSVLISAVHNSSYRAVGRDRGTIGIIGLTRLISRWHHRLLQALYGRDQLGDSFADTNN